VPRLRVAPCDQAPFRRQHAARCRPVLLPGHARLQPRSRRLLRWRLRLQQLGDFVSRLTDAVGGRRPGQVQREGARLAAVAVVLSEGVDPALVLIRRKVRAADPWSGQMAFPGGYQADGSEPLEDTARRETLEETGLDLISLGKFRGTLDDVSPRTPFLPPLVVRPHLFTVTTATPLSAGDEADAALWIPVSELFDPTRQTLFSFPLPDGVRQFPAIAVGEHLIWGLTERILRQVADLAGP
jgi:8-oxo-dGTP pyrophosphatase MutT (NUDIX family)